MKIWLADRLRGLGHWLLRLASRLDPPPKLEDIVATTLRNRSGRLADNVMRNNEMLCRLRELEQVKAIDFEQEWR